MKTISIKGVGKAKRDPDLVIFNITTLIYKKEYADSVDESNKLINNLKDEFEKIGFKRQDIKTVRYYTRPVYNDVEVGVINKKKKMQLECFKVIHNLKIEFDLDNDRIHEVLKCLKNFKKNLKFEIDFSVKDKDSMKKDIIIDATKNARFYAEILAEASSVELGDLIKIEYEWDDIRFYSDSDYRMFLESPLYHEEIEFNPDSVEISDSVSFVWEIK